MNARKKWLEGYRHRQKGRKKIIMLKHGKWYVSHQYRDIGPFPTRDIAENFAKGL